MVTKNSNVNKLIVNLTLLGQRYFYFALRCRACQEYSINCILGEVWFQIGCKSVGLLRQCQSDQQCFFSPTEIYNYGSVGEQSHPLKEAGLFDFA